jgi:hypothetical protein
MKIALVGKGTASIITALTCILRGHSVDIFYDPNVPFIKVGETTTPHITSLVYDVLGITIHDLCKEGITSYKIGVKFIDWGVGKPFLSNFGGNALSVHFDTVKFNDYIHKVLQERGLVKYIPERVENYFPINDNPFSSGRNITVNNRSYDFIVYTSGWSDQDQYLEPFIQTVNSAVLYKDTVIDSDCMSTIHRATEDGWEFGLPFPKEGITKRGYLYDRNLISKENVLKKLEGKDIANTIEWNPKYAKKLIQDRFCAYNGNKVFFFDPLHAFGLFYYSLFANLICNYLEDPNPKTFSQCNAEYQNMIWSHHFALAFHYKYGSTHSSEFWNRTAKVSNQICSSSLSMNPEIQLNNLVTDHYFTTIHRERTDFSDIKPFSYHEILEIHAGMLGISENEVLSNNPFVY